MGDPLYFLGIFIEKREINYLKLLVTPKLNKKEN
jgi:hypothetical protein